ncbi:MAG: hypothetical protein Q9227_001650 [Pyrenula ochraceoflavens]
MANTHELRLTSLFNLEDFVCLISGGAKVYITGRRLEALQQAAKQHSPDPKISKGQIIPIGPCDVTSKDSLDKLVHEISAKEKYLSLLVAAAGVSGPKAPPEGQTAAEIKDALWNKETPEAWNSTYNTNVSSVFFTTVAVLPLLEAAPENHNASAIVISSMSGMMRHAQGHFSYNAAKAATAHLSRMMSREFAKSNVRVNSIAPGYFPSEMTMGSTDERQKTEMPTEKVLSKGHSVPAGRSGKDEEMAMAVIFLAKCGYVNGEIIKVDGGVMNEVGGA